MNEKELIWLIHSISKYGDTTLKRKLERKLQDLRRYEYPARGKARELIRSIKEK